MSLSGNMLTTLLVTVVTVLTLLMGTLSGLVFRKLYSSGSASMATFQLNSEETKKQFKILYYSHLFMASGGILLVVGSFGGIKLFRDMGRILFMGYPFTASFVFYKWWRQF